MEPVIGIDLGTTNSAVAHMTGDGPKIILNSLGGRLTPSVVGITEAGTVVVGAAAKELRVLHPERTASLFKRWMGTDRIVELAGKKFTPEELSSLVLRSLKADAEAYFQKPVHRAVISVPAYFNDQQRKATIAAGRLAGLTVERILNEPTAAAIAYGFQDAGTDKTILIYDLGGGTFDVSVVELFDGTLEVRASAGETSLGGEDFTRTMAARVLEKAGLGFERAEATMPLVVARLIQQCEKAKCQLSTDSEAVVRWPDQSGELGKNPDVTVTRADLENWIEPILGRTALPIRRVMVDARLTRDQIQEVILVGGATRMPTVIARVREQFGHEPQCRLNPDEVVALGAAVQAGLVERNAAVEDLVVTDVSPFTLGIEVTKEFGTEFKDGFFDPIIDRNTVIPVSRVKTYTTLVPNQTSIHVKVYQGESRKTGENLFLGEFEVAGIPPGPRGQMVEIRFTYDLNGVLEIEATISATKKKITHIITRHAKGMSEAAIREAVRAMEKLKAHPRDEAKNHYILVRADRVYKELSTDLRRYLSSLIDGFEAALESRDPSAIENHREAVEQFLNSYDPTEGGGEAND